MKQTKAPRSTPSPQSQAQQPRKEGGKESSPSSVFITMALDMSWRLAIVVLVPIIGGFKLDEALELTPLLTIVGFLMAMVGMALVMWRTTQEANKMPVPNKKENDS